MKPYLKAQYYIPVIGFVFIAFYALFLITGGEMQVEERPGGSLGQDKDGYFLFYKVFQKLGYRMQRRFGAELPPKGGCILYFDYFSSNSSMPDRDRVPMDKILDWVKQGNVLFLVGVQSGRDPVFSRRVGSGPAQDIRISKEVTTGSYKFSFSRSNFIVSRLSDEVLMQSESGALSVRAGVGEGWVVLFPGNDLFVNRYFSNPHHALFLNDLLRNYYGEKFYLYEYGSPISAYRVGNPVMVLFKGDFLWVTLHLFTIGLIFAVWKGKRFGKPLRADPFKRRSITVHLEAVGGFYQKTGAGKIVDSIIGKYFIFRLKQVLNLKKPVSPNELAEMTARHSGKSVEKINLLLGEPAGLPGPALLMKQRDFHEIIDDIRVNKK